MGTTLASSTILGNHSIVCGSIPIDPVYYIYLKGGKENGEIQSI